MFKEKTQPSQSLRESRGIQKAVEGPFKAESAFLSDLLNYVILTGVFCAAIYVLLKVC